MTQLTRRAFLGGSVVGTSAGLTTGMLETEPVCGAEPSKAELPLLKAQVETDLRTTYPDFFADWKGKSGIDPAPFHAGERGEVVMYWDKDHALATSDEGRTWHAYRGRRLWPEGGSFPVARIGEDLVAIRDGQWVQRSRDGGQTWNQAEPIPKATSPKYASLKGPYVFSVEVTRKGRIIIPEDYLTGREGPDPDILFTNVSDDGGRTWRRSPVIEPPDPLPKAPEGFGEPAAVELPNGAVWLVFRSTFGELWQAISSDGGLTWSPPCPTGLASPLSNVKAKRIPGTDAIVLLWNHTVPGPSKDFGANPGIYRPRAPLVFAVSHDSCRTWTCPVVIYRGTGVYPQVHFTDNSMIVAYMSNPNPGVGGGAPYSVTASVYDKNEVLRLPPWTYQTIRPYVADGRVAHWLALATQR